MSPRVRRHISGILLLDKDAGMSSNQALQAAKRMFDARKAGHTGNLDLLATGLLPVCLGEATKVTGFLLDAEKGYDAEFVLGAVTSTGDAEGEIVERHAVPDLTVARIEEVLRSLLGELEQIPPMHSALKHRGQRLYALAHKGIEVERKPRKVTIRELRLQAFSGSRLRVSVLCSKGTYIRTLAEDFGRRLGCGAYVGALRRTAVGPFRLADAVTLDQLQGALTSGGVPALDRHLLGIDSALVSEPAVSLSRDAAYYLSHGQPVMVPHAPVRGLVRLYDEQRQFLGVGHVLDDGRIAPRRLMAH